VVVVTYSNGPKLTCQLRGPSGGRSERLLFEAT